MSTEGPNAMQIFSAIAETFQNQTQILQDIKAHNTQLQTQQHTFTMSNPSWCQDKHFDGNRSKFSEWIQNIDKQSTLTNNPHKHLLAYQSSTGPVSEYIKRYLESHSPVDWADLKSHLTKCFGDIQDPSHAFALLKQIHQKPGEPVQLFAQRILSLAEQYYVGHSLTDPIIAKQLVGFFEDGLESSSLKFKIMRNRFTNFQAAIDCAVSEQNLHHQFALRSNYSPQIIPEYPEEPMEIDLAQSTYRHHSPNHFSRTSTHAPATHNRGRSYTRQYSPPFQNRSYAQTNNSHPRHTHYSQPRYRHPTNNSRPSFQQHNTHSRHSQHPHSHRPQHFQSNGHPPFPHHPNPSRYPTSRNFPRYSGN